MSLPVLHPKHPYSSPPCLPPLFSSCVAYMYNVYMGYVHMCVLSVRGPDGHVRCPACNFLPRVFLTEPQ